jgi:hypothetical protein
MSQTSSFFCWALIRNLPVHSKEAFLPHLLHAFSTSGAAAGTIFHRIVSIFTLSGLCARKEKNARRLKTSGRAVKAGRDHSAPSVPKALLHFHFPYGKRSPAHAGPFCRLFN